MFSSLFFNNRTAKPEIVKGHGGRWKHGTEQALRWWVGEWGNWGQHDGSCSNERCLTRLMDVRNRDATAPEGVDGWMLRTNGWVDDVNEWIEAESEQTMDDHGRRMMGMNGRTNTELCTQGQLYPSCSSPPLHTIVWSKPPPASHLGIGDSLPLTPHSALHAKAVPIFVTIDLFWLAPWHMWDS